jgi:hypothetical protein
MKGINLAPLACRLRHICLELRDAAAALPSPPSWRMQQVHMPHIWNVRRPVGGRPKWFSEVAFCRWGLVGVDVKSHQADTDIPHPVVTRGNELQDVGCEEARDRRLPDDVRIPTGGPFAFFTLHGRMITAPIREALRVHLRNEAVAKWGRRPVQGKLARIHCKAHAGCLDLRAGRTATVVFGRGPRPG